MFNVQYVEMELTLVKYLILLWILAPFGLNASDVIFDDVRKLDKTGMQYILASALLLTTEILLIRQGLCFKEGRLGAGYINY